MQTNKLNVTLHIKTIDRDFDIYLLEKQKKDAESQKYCFQSDILDSLVHDYKALAVQWLYGPVVLVLYGKGEVEMRKLKEYASGVEPDIDIQKIDLSDEEQRQKYFQRQDRRLVQLLFNSMWTQKREALMRYNNLTGGLYYFLNSESQLLHFLKIVIDDGMYLNLVVQTYKKAESALKGQYVLDDKTGEFRRKLKSDAVKMPDTYEKGTLSKKRARVDNFDFSDYEHFRKSKLGVMEKFLRDVETNLSEYMTIELEDRSDAETYAISKLEKKGISDETYGKLLRKRGVVIVDENHTDKSQELIGRLQMELQKRYQIEPRIGALSQEAYHIRMIHEPAYYENNNMEDPHQDALQGYIVQHVMEEAVHFTKDKSPDTQKIVQELIIKGDVRDGQISIFDWQRLGAQKEWTFVIREPIKDEKGEWIVFNYYRLKIDCSGKLEFDTFCESAEETAEERRRICDAYKDVKKRYHCRENEIDGLVYTDIHHIHAILLTKEQTLPNLTAVSEALRQTNPDKKVPKNVLLEAMNEFETLNPDFEGRISQWREKIKDNMISKKVLKEHLNMRTKAASAFNRFLHERYDIWLDGELRKEEFETCYELGNLLDIKYEYITDEYIDGRAVKYYVGAKSQNKRTSYPNACRIRKIISLSDNLEYQELFPLMAVDFVRNNQYTVLPFPFKYLREYKEQIKKGV